MTSAITGLITFLIDKFGRFAVKQGILMTAKAVTWVAVVSFYSFIFIGFLKIYDLINSIFIKIDNFKDNTGNNCLVSSIFHTFDCVGLTSVFNDTFPLFLSAFVFWITAILYKYLLAIKNKIEQDIKDLLKLV
jgi:hypothetical protein